MAIYGNTTSNVRVDNMIETFKRDVDEGLSKKSKTLPSKYFYDKRGDELFVEIMNMPEYYLTNCEFEILSEQSSTIIEAFGFDDEPFELIELGAGDGTKTIELLKRLNHKYVTYKPVDISLNAIEKLEKRLVHELPSLNVDGKQGMYFKVLSELSSDKPKVILFLGSNIGNLIDDQAKSFMQQLSDVMNPGDKILVGFDLKKDASIVLPAYNDPHGFTRDFNLNLLQRINRELGGNFKIDQFGHAPGYDESSGLAYSYIESLTDQNVYIDSLDKTFHFNAGEKIHTEISRKYDEQTIQEIIEGTDLSIHARFSDSQQYFSDIIFKKQ